MWTLTQYIFSLFQTSLDQATDDWGIKVERVEIKDVKLPHQLQRAMAAEAEASREARAKVRTYTITWHMQYMHIVWHKHVLQKNNNRQHCAQTSSPTY